MFSKKQPPTPDRARRPVPPVQRSQVFSYNANRAPRPVVNRDESPASNQAAGSRFRMPRLKGLPQLVILVLVAGLLLANIRLSADAKLLTLESEGQIFLRDQAQYQAAAHDALASLANSNKLTINTSGIAAKLQKQFPELSSVSVSLPLLGTQPVVYLQPATPALILSSQGRLYVVDAMGRALVTSNQVPSLPKLKLPVVTDESGLDIRVGGVVLPRATVAFIQDVVYQLKAKEITVTSLALPAGTGELHVRMEGVGYYVKYNLYGSSREEVGGYLALREQLAAEQKAPKEYIDVRVEGRAYYR